MRSVRLRVTVILAVIDILQCESNDDISTEHQCAMADIVQALESLPVFSVVRELIGKTDSDGFKSTQTGGRWPSCRTTRAHLSLIHI